jgi:hypothetical protein
LILSRFQAERHLGGAERSLELAAIGRRVCESEYDLLDALDLLDTTASVTPPQPTRSTLHDRPGVAEILDLVAGTLAEDIAPALTEDRERQRYLLRICMSLLRICGRELQEAGAESRVAELLDALHCSSERELAEKLRAGALAYADDEVRRTVSAAVLSRLRVANPKHLG